MEVGPGMFFNFISPDSTMTSFPGYRKISLLRASWTSSWKYQHNVFYFTWSAFSPCSWCVVLTCIFRGTLSSFPVNQDINVPLPDCEPSTAKRAHNAENVNTFRKASLYIFTDKSHSKVTTSICRKIMLTLLRCNSVGSSVVFWWCDWQLCVNQAWCLLLFRIKMNRSVKKAGFSRSIEIVSCTPEGNSAGKETYDEIEHEMDQYKASSRRLKRSTHTQTLEQEDNEDIISRTARRKRG